MKNVSHKNAPGAISAIALIVRPPRPNVALVVGFFSFVDISLSFFASELRDLRTAMSRRQDGDVPGDTCSAKIKKALDPLPRIEDFIVFPPDTSLYRNTDLITKF